MDTLASEARLFTRYLIGRDASPQAVQLYEAAMSDSQPVGADKKLLDFMTSHPSSIGLVDAGLVFHDPDSEARRRLYVMLAIVEASPEYYDLFLPENRGPLYILVIIYAGARGVIKAALGLVLVKVIA